MVEAYRTVTLPPQHIGKRQPRTRSLISRTTMI